LGRHRRPLRQILRSIDHPALGANWDPGNAFFAGDQPFPSGYEALKGLVRHIHFKDAMRDPSGECHFVLDGQIDWAGQIQALAADGYSGYLSIETHARPKVASARYTLQRLRSLMSAAGVPDVGLSQ
jgi:sugar phosphate isomerase/epimerase